VTLPRFSEAEVRIVDGARSHLFRDGRDLGCREAGSNVGEIEAGARQRSHAHADDEQVYIVIQGEGKVSAGKEAADVSRGDLVAIPPNPVHEIAGELLTHG
jgi:quercetin dioxygenase-like cupin family protein